MSLVRGCNESPQDDDIHTTHIRDGLPRFDRQGLRLGQAIFLILLASSNSAGLQWPRTCLRVGASRHPPSGGRPATEPGSCHVRGVAGHRHAGDLPGLGRNWQAIYAALGRAKSQGPFGLRAASLLSQPRSAPEKPNQRITNELKLTFRLFPP